MCRKALYCHLYVLILFTHGVIAGSYLNKCVTFKPSSDTLTVPQNGLANLTFTIEQQCFPRQVALESIYVQFTNPKKAKSNIRQAVHCQMLQNLPNGSWSTSPGCSCLSENSFFISRNVTEPQGETWTITGKTVNKDEATPVIVNVTVIQDETTTDEDEDENFFSDLNNVYIVLGASGGVIFILLLLCIGSCTLHCKRRGQLQSQISLSQSIFNRNQRDMDGTFSEEFPLPSTSQDMESSHTYSDIPDEVKAAVLRKQTDQSRRLPSIPTAPPSEETLKTKSLCVAETPNPSSSALRFESAPDSRTSRVENIDVHAELNISSMKSKHTKLWPNLRSSSVEETIIPVETGSSPSSPMPTKLDQVSAMAKPKPGSPKPCTKNPKLAPALRSSRIEESTDAPAETVSFPKSTLLADEVSAAEKPFSARSFPKTQSLLPMKGHTEMMNTKSQSLLPKGQKEMMNYTKPLPPIPKERREKIDTKPLSPLPKGQREIMDTKTKSPLPKGQSQTQDIYVDETADGYVPPSPAPWFCGATPPTTPTSPSSPPTEMDDSYLTRPVYKAEKQSLLSASEQEPQPDARGQNLRAASEKESQSNASCSEKVSEKESESCLSSSEVASYFNSPVYSPDKLKRLDKCAKLSDKWAKTLDKCAQSDKCANSSDTGAKSSDKCAKSSETCAKLAETYAKSPDICAKSSDKCAKSSDKCAKLSDKCATSSDKSAQSLDECAKTGPPPLPKKLHLHINSPEEVKSLDMCPNTGPPPIPRKLPIHSSSSESDPNSEKLVDSKDPFTRSASERGVGGPTEPTHSSPWKKLHKWNPFSSKEDKAKEKTVGDPREISGGSLPLSRIGRRPLLPELKPPKIPHPESPRTPNPEPPRTPLCQEPQEPSTDGDGYLVPSKVKQEEEGYTLPSEK